MCFHLNSMNDLHFSVVMGWFYAQLGGRCSKSKWKEAREIGIECCICCSSLFYAFARVAS